MNYIYKNCFCKYFWSDKERKHRWDFSRHADDSDGADLSLRLPMKIG